MRCNLGMALSQIPGKMPDAIAMFESALQINPNLVEAHFLLGTALAQMPGRTQDAAAEYQTALQLRPDFEPAKQALAELPK
jgi:cytochrome c-type biogenesis protein CcmH/NrfG